MRLSVSMLAVAACCLALASGVLAALLPSPDEASRGAWRESLRFEQNGDFGGALSALRAMPGSYAVSLRMGWLEYRAGNFSASADRYTDALRASPRSLEARLGLLLPMLALGRFGEAESVAREVLRESPANPLAGARLAAALRLQGKLKEAGRVLDPALKTQPTNVGLLNEFALVNAAQHRLSAARQLFNEVITLDPANAVALEQLSSPRLSASLGGTNGTSAVALIEPRTNGAMHGSATAYFGGISYDNTTYKDYAWVGGVNGWLDLNRLHLFEAGLDWMDIAYKQLPHLSQVDATAAYANFGISGIKLRLGGHYIATDDAPTDNGWVAFGGMDWFAAPRWSLGMDGFFTRYPNYGPPLDVVQLTPRLRLNLAQGADWSLRTDVTGYWTQTGRSVAGLDQRNFLSGEASLSLIWRRWTLSGAGWAGQQAFTVRNSGYTVFNLAEEHTTGYGVGIQRVLGRKLTADFRFRREEFREIFTTANAAENLFMGAIGLNF